MIISVGYRVKSKRGTQFRQWATRVLRDHLVKGFTVHEQRLREESAKFKELRQTVDLLARTLTSQELVTDTGKEVLQVITDYAYGLALLDRYDHGQLTIEGTTRKTGHQLDYDEAIGIVTSMKGAFDGLKSQVGARFIALKSANCSLGHLCAIKQGAMNRAPTCMAG